MGELLPFQCPSDFQWLPSPCSGCKAILYLFHLSHCSGPKPFTRQHNPIQQFPAYGVLATSPLTNFHLIPSKAFWNLPCVQKLTLRKFSLQLSAEWVSKRKQNTFCENYGLERCSCRSRPSELTTALVASPTVGDSIGQNVPIVCWESRVV